MPQIHISVRDKVARAARRTPSIVCGNADYEIVFDFDSEWDVHDQKIARFIWGGAYFDVPFMGNVCPVPTVVYAAEVEVGVYAEELRTTTPATIACRRSVRSDPSQQQHSAQPHKRKTQRVKQRRVPHRQRRPLAKQQTSCQ